MLVTCVVDEIIQLWIFVCADPLWPYTKDKIIQTSMNRDAMHKSTVMPSLDAMV